MQIRLTAVLLQLFKKPWCNIEFMLAQWTDAHGQRIQIASIHCPKNNLIFPIKKNRPATARANATVYIWVFFILVYVWPRHQINPNASAPIVIGSFSICRDWDYFWDSVADTNRCIFCFYLVIGCDETHTFCIFEIRHLLYSTVPFVTHVHQQQVYSYNW